MVCQGIKKYIFVSTLFIASGNADNRIDIASFNPEQIACDFIKKPSALGNASIIPSRQQKKPWTLIIYVAADNDLRNFAIRNIKQMSNIGSNQHVNVVVHIDIRVNGNYKITRRYYIDKDQIIQLNTHDPHSQQMDSGDPKTLISCCSCAIENFPAENYALIFWDHGTGIIDPGYGRIINPAELFVFNPHSGKFDLDRSIGFLDLIYNLNKEQRGICWDDTTGHYLTNQKLDAALSEIQGKLLGGKKFQIIGFDACLMSMIEVANIVKKYADIMVSSQEVELGTGWDYEHVLSLFQYEIPTPQSFAQHIVRVYEKVYNYTDDFTQSAINLSKTDAIEANINLVSQLLVESLRTQKNNSVKNALRTCRNKFLLTHFDEYSYVDLDHLYQNIIENLKHFVLHDSAQTNIVKQKLTHLLKEGRMLIADAIIANVCGKNLSKAGGISIYFPDPDQKMRLHSSYPLTSFANSNAWINFIKQYLSI